MTRKTRLELTWIGKDERPRLEPRILVEDAALSYHASARHSQADIFDNRLIQADNLLALKGLVSELAGQIRCVFIDPPYNTGTAFDQYDDGLEQVPSGKWLEFGLALSPGSTKVSFQAATSIG